MEVLNSSEVENKLEDQIILRLPKEEARYVHKLLASKKPKKIEKHLKIDLNEDTRAGTIYIKQKVIPVRLVDLPTIIESSKSLNNVTCYKTADICQMLICKNDDKDLEGIKIKYPHGLTPPMKNVSKNRFRKTLKNRDEILINDYEIHKEVKFLLKADYEAVSSRYEIIYEPNESSNEEISEKNLFGDVSSDSSESTNSSNYDIIDFN